MEEDNQEYEFWYDEKGRVVGKQLICDVYGYDDLDDEL